MRNLATGIAMLSIIALGGIAFAQEQNEEGARPTPAQCYSPCAAQYSNAADRLRCISACCGC